MKNCKDAPRPPLTTWPLIGLIRIYRYSLSMLIGRTCRHLPTCSEYMEEALTRHGVWAGLWIGTGRLCRCRPGPGGTSGLDPVPQRLPERASSFTPWRYARWASVEPIPPETRFACDAPPPERGGPSP